MGHFGQDFREAQRNRYYHGSITRLHLLVFLSLTKSLYGRPLTSPISKEPTLVENVNVKGLYHPRPILIEITKFSSTVPTNLFFNFYSCVEDQDLIIIAAKTPNIIKLALPVTTLVLHKRNNLRAIGENCKNLINLKLGCYVDEEVAEQITRYLTNLKRLSLRWSVISNIEEVYSIITRLQNLKILNISHCIFRDRLSRPTYGMVHEDSFVRTATQKVDTLIRCSKVDCWLCEAFVNSFDFAEKHWRNDEIKELKF